MNSTWGGKKTPGGNGWKYGCAVRLRFSKGEYLDADGKSLTRSAENPAGNMVLMSMTKNRTCMPTRRVGRYRINYMEGIDYLKDLVDVAIDYEIVEQHGAWFTIVDVENGEVLKDKIQGKASLFTLLEEDRDLLEKVETIVNRKLEVE